MLASTIIALFSLIGSEAPGQVRSSGICWVSDVVVSGEGVRIYFRRVGGPTYISASDGIFRPSIAPIDPARPDEAALEAKLGDLVGATNGPEDGCSLVVVKKDGRIGVEAKASFNLPGAPSQSRSEFIPAHD